MVRQAVVRYIASGLLAVVFISLLGVWLFSRAGVAEALRDAKDQTRITAEGSVQPAVSDELVDGRPAAIAAVDQVVKDRVLNDKSIVRVKIWDSTGRIVYSDEPRLIGARYPPDAEARAEFASGEADAEVTNLSEPENRFERQFGRLLEVYLPIHTPGGTQLQYEAYYRSSFVDARARRIFRHFAPVMLGALILLALLQLPFAWRLAKRVQKGQQEREQLLNRAVEASEVERRRIAQDLHDGVVQDLAAVSYSLAAAAEGAPAPFDDQLREAAAETRHGIGQLRTLLVEIYPPEIQRAGLAAALSDLLDACRSRGLETTLEIDPELELDPTTKALFFRVAQESLRNVVKHAGATQVSVNVGVEDSRARLVVDDDGHGFDREQSTGDGHFGLRILADLVRDASGSLEVDTAPGKGSRVCVEVPV